MARRHHGRGDVDTRHAAWAQYSKSSRRRYTSRSSRGRWAGPHGPIEPRGVVRSKAAPDREVVGAIEDIDRVELQAAHVLDEAAQPAGAQGGRSRPGQMLALQEER